MKIKTLQEMEREQALHRSFVDRLNIANQKTPSEIFANLPFSNSRWPIRLLFHLLRGLTILVKGRRRRRGWLLVLLLFVLGYYATPLVTLAGGALLLVMASLMYTPTKQRQDELLILGARQLDATLGDKRYATWLEQAEFVKADRAYRYIYTGAWISKEQLQRWAEEMNTEVLFADMVDVMVEEKRTETIQAKGPDGGMQPKEVVQKQVVPTKKFVIVLQNIGSWKSEEELLRMKERKVELQENKKRLQGFHRFFQHQFTEQQPVLQHEDEDGWEKTYIFSHDGATLDDWKRQNGKDRLSSFLGQEVVDIRRSSRYHRHIEVVVAKQEVPEKLHFSTDLVPEEDRLFCVGMSHKPILIDFDKVPHLIVAATTGGGKSVCMNNLVTQAAMRNSILCFADFKGTETVLVKEKGYRVVHRSPEFLTLLEDILRESEDRSRLFQTVKVPDIHQYRLKTGAQLPRIFLFIDEAAQFLAEAEDNQLQAKLLRASQEVRFAGIHIILCTQRPSAEVLPTDIRINLAGRIVGYLPDDQSSRMVLGSNAAHTVLAGKLYTGRMIVGGAYGPDLEVQTPYINFAKMDELIPTCREHALSK